MYSNVFLKTLRDGRRSMLLFALAQFVFGIYLALLFPDVATSFANLLGDLPEFIQAFVGSAEEFATPEGFFTTDPYGVVTPIVMIALAINRGWARWQVKNRRIHSTNSWAIRSAG